LFAGRACAVYSTSHIPRPTFHVPRSTFLHSLPLGGSSESL
jgi:hypothetical protein